MDVPFFSNTPDDTHCFQAALRMVLKYFQPEREFSWEELDIISGKKEGLWTWPFAASVWMKNQGFEVVNIDPFDNRRFIVEGEVYLVELFGKDVAAVQAAHSDLEHERIQGKAFIDQIVVDQRIPTVSDLQNLVSQGFLLICNVNSRMLAEKDGYAGHAIVVTGVEGDMVIFHNPGLPAEEGAHVKMDVFEKAWASPNEAAKNILAFRVLK